MLGKARYKVVSNVPNAMQESSVTKSELTVRAATQGSTATHPCRLAVAYRAALDLGLKKKVPNVINARPVDSVTLRDKTVKNVPKESIVVQRILLTNAVIAILVHFQN